MSKPPLTPEEITQLVSTCCDSRDHAEKIQCARKVAEAYERLYRESVK